MGKWHLFAVVSSQRTSTRRRSGASAPSFGYRQDSARGDQPPNAVQSRPPERLRTHHSQSSLGARRRAAAPAAGARCCTAPWRPPSSGLARRRKVVFTTFPQPGIGLLLLAAGFDVPPPVGAG